MILKLTKMQMTPFTILDNMYGQNTRCVTDQLRVSRGVNFLSLESAIGGDLKTDKK